MSVPHARRGRATLLVLVVTAVLAALLTTPGAQARSAAPDTRKAGAASSGAEARQALVRAQAVLSGAGVGVAARGYAASPSTTDATLVLRDLAVLKGQLTGADRVAADRLLARPTDPGDDDPYGANVETVICSAVVCVHYVTTGPEATTPTFAQTTLDTATHVHQTYVAAGYRAPKPDGTKGGNALPDVYIANIGDKGLYGYCTTDQTIPQHGPFDVWAYCVVDNNYSPAEFPTNTPLENLQVTVAHEYFHAVQYAYDVLEDGWFLESTAAWAEDELYDGVDDNVQYLRTSPLTRPRQPVDSADGIGIYGSWIFFRYLSEKFPASAGGIPTIVRDILRKLDGASGGPDQYSWQGIATILKQRGTTATKMMAAFADANRRPGKAYSEGAANHYPTPKLVDQAKLGKRGVQAGIKLNHLSSASYRLSPGSVLSAKSWKLRVNLDLQPSVRGSAAVVTTYFKSGAVKATIAKLNTKGDKSLAVPFSRKKVKYVEITLVNGSGRFTGCFTGGNYSCQGFSKDDHLLEAFTARAFR